MKKSFTTISPIDNQAILTKNFLTRLEIDQVVANSSLAYLEWKFTSLETRKQLVSKFLEQLVLEKESLAEEICLHMGRPIRYTTSEIVTTKLRGDYLVSQASAKLSPEVVATDPNFEKTIVKEPLGVTLFLAPWNYPYLTTINGLVPSLLAGNTVLMKVSPQTPNVAENYQRILERVGLPKQVFQSVQVDLEDVEYLVGKGEVRFVNFTGSVDNGKKINRYVGGADQFKGLGLELGGKDPALVRSDCDLDYTVANLVDGVLFNSGQSCCSVERIYVHQPIFDLFVTKFVQRTQEYVLDDPRLETTTLGPMVSIQSAQKVHEQVQEAVQLGAKTWIDPSLFPKAKVGTTYVAPQVLTQVNHQMKLMTEETFGPVVGIMPVASDEEAIQLMNDSPFGLTASLWTSDEFKVTELGPHLDFGTIFMNRCDYPDPSLPWSGRKLSGKGYALSHMGFDCFVQPKSYHLKRKL